MSNIDDWMDEPEQAVEQCDSCPHPNGCIRACVIAEYQHEEVADIRGENEL